MLGVEGSERKRNCGEKVQFVWKQSLSRRARGRSERTKEKLWPILLNIWAKLPHYQLFVGHAFTDVVQTWHTDHE